MLIKREVLENVKPAFYRIWDKEGVVQVGSDLLFCQRAKEAGFEVWADYSCACQHYKLCDLTQLYSLMKVRDITNANRKNINTPEYWDEQWRKRPDRQMATYPHIVSRVKEYMNGQKPFKVLDFGCGRGELLEHISQIDGVEVFGLDYSKEAIEIVRKRGLIADVGDRPFGKWDMIVCSEVLEHLDDDDVMLSTLLEHSDIVLYTVPNNCLPPGQEPEHRRCYTIPYVKTITPFVSEISIIDDYLLVVADRKGNKNGRIKQELDVCVRSAVPG